jgi:hypothetical protein
MRKLGTKSKAALATIALLLIFSSVGISLYNGQNNSIQSLTESCFESFTEDIEFTELTVEILTLLPNIEREEVNLAQLSCVISALGFPEDLVETIQSQQEGREDNDSFQLKWDTKPVCTDKSVYNSSKASTCSGDAAGRPALQLVFKDFRN